MGVGLPQKENIFPLWVLPQDWWGQEIDKEAWTCDCLWAWGTGDLYAGMRDLFRAFPSWGGKLIPGTETGLSLGKEGWTIKNAYGGLWSVTSENLYIQEQLWSSLSVFPFPFFLNPEAISEIMQTSQLIFLLGGIVWQSGMAPGVKAIHGRAAARDLRMSVAGKRMMQWSRTRQLVKMFIKNWLGISQGFKTAYKKGKLVK